jgi:hypothetical protein
MMGLRRRRLLLVVLGAVGLLVGGLAAWLQLPRPGVTRANYERIQEGMTLPEVAGILGGPPGNYSRFPDNEAGLWALDWADPELGLQYFRGREACVGTELAVAVWFNDQGRVRRKAAFEVPEPTFLDRLRRLLRL